MIIPFYKYQGTGNDFVMIDNRNLEFPKKNTSFISRICDRHFGIGADGLILLENDIETDFAMVYYNSDGNESTMCGNGGRCIVAFAKQLNLIEKETTFIAIDGKHNASIENDIVSLQMIDVDKVQIYDSHVFANTGSPHHVEVVKNIDEYPVFKNGRKIRNQLYGKEGSNINFIEHQNDNSFRIRTYERGVENETLACGTGVTAAAIAMHATKKTHKKTIKLQVEGGELTVSFDEDNGSYSNVILTGPATFVYKGQIELK